MAKSENEIRLITFPVLDEKDIRGIVRGEIRLPDPGNASLWLLKVKENLRYRITAEDLLAGVESLLRENNPKKSALPWLIQILDSGVSLFPDCEQAEAVPAKKEFTESLVLSCAKNLLTHLRAVARFYSEAQYTELLHSVQQLLQTWLNTGGSREKLPEYPDAFLQYLTPNLTAENLDTAEPAEQELFKTCLDLLCERKDPEALEKRAYCYYNGTKVYPQDWIKARDAFLDLYKQTGSPFTANTLGYIYYYGRCSQGVPDYSRAFYFFSIGHAGDVYESTYKLGDMFARGLGVTKNEEIAYPLYDAAYEDNRFYFMLGETDCDFADTALRLGQCWHEGVGTDQDPWMACFYYLQARLAIRMRIRDHRKYGDENVQNKIDALLSEVWKACPACSGTLRGTNPFWLNWLSRKGPHLLSWKSLKDGRIRLDCRDVYNDQPGRSMLLVTCPEEDFCDLMKSVRVYTAPDAEITSPEGRAEILFDSSTYLEEENRLILFRGSMEVGRIVTGGYSFTIPGKTHEQGEAFGQKRSTQPCSAAVSEGGSKH